MLPKVIYELLPSGYLSAGTGSILLLDPWLANLGGAILFAMGALIWVIRSNYRRDDRDRKSFITKHKVLPEALYEFIPFAYLASAVLLLSLLSNTPSLFLALVACYRGLKLLYKRSQYRNHRLSRAN
ncbi:hypothetical protein [Agarivorans sp. QJM3NY_33]|uniref:hypothetical protein n=1 Tax=Agarivorans sp. QJM3NY_33 TaxID=3421432 RepID=UPI003D7C998D